MLHLDIFFRFTLGMLKYSSSSKHPIILCHIVPVIRTKLLTDDVIVTHNIYSTRDLVKDEVNFDGKLMLFDMNHACEELLPSVRVVSRQLKYFQKEYHCYLQNSNTMLNLRTITDSENM